MPDEDRSRNRAGTFVAIALGIVVIAVAVAALHHRSDSGGSHPALVDPASALQIRGVRSIVSPSSSDYATTKTTCGAADACTTEDLLQASNIVLADDTGLKYRLGPVTVTGADVASARATPENAETSAWTVKLKLTNAARIKFAAWTERLAEVLPPRQIAMIVDGQLLEAPTVQSPVTSGSVKIGNLTEEQARSLAGRLNQRPPSPTR